MSMTIRDRIGSIAAAMRDDDPSPAEIRSYEVTLAALVWSCNLEVSKAEIDFKRAIQEADAKTAAGRKQIAEAGPTYARLVEAQAVRESCMEMLRTCRSHGRSLSEEMRLQR